ncbi:Mu-like prophage major head subunit gpT family protein, partial [Escherichia coli]|nr:Mu-like prophage major head subunit gpT family protein [Escherichia coli]
EAVLLPAYAQKTGKTTDEIAAMLADETWMSGAECLAHGFADQVTPAVKAMACIQSKRTEEFKKMPESIRNMITPPRNSAPRVQDDEPAASRTPVQAAAPVVDENSIRAQVLAEQKARVNGINDLFAMFGGRYQTLQAQCLADPECSLEQAREKLLNEMGRESTPSNKNTPAHIYAGNGNFVGDGIRQALMARAGFEKNERDNVYNGMTLREYARMSLTERGHGFADQVTPAVKAMACIQSKRTEEFKKMPESIRNMITPPRNSAPRVQDDEPAASRTPVQAAAPVVDENSIRAQVLAEQKARVNGINDLFAMFGGRYQTLQAQCLADPECSLEQAREKLLNEMGRESTPSNKNTPAHIYAGNGNFVGDGIRQALMARAGFEKTERDNVYNGMTLREYARMSLTERGIGVSSYNPMQMVGAAFTHSTSDFGNILLDVANKAILQGWEDAPETYEQWTRKGQLSDFKIAHRVGMGGFSALRQVREGAEYKYVTTGDKQATIALATYGELFSITRQAIINDDLNMLTDVPMKLGRAAKSTIADLVYAILTSNPKISTDNVSLFDKAKHANVLESAAMDVASLDKARQLMRVQKEGERHLNIRPAFVLVPTAMESVANQVIRSSSVKGADINAGIINPVKDFATVIAEPRLDDNSQTTFYLAASKGSDTIEVAYLNGVDTPYIDQMEGFSVDGVTTKVRIDAGVAPVDHRGLVKCTA